MQRAAYTEPAEMVQASPASAKQQMSVTRVAEVLDALDRITGGRVVKGTGFVNKCNSPFVVTKSSNIPGKAVTETPGLVYGDLESRVSKLGVSMTLTESQLELSCALGIDAVVAHHPVADAANSGGVPLKSYLSLYGISVFELHEAFHGLHPGLAFIHGHKAFRVDIAYGGIPGNIMNVGKALPEVKTAGDIVRRLEGFAGIEEEISILRAEREIRGVQQIDETNVCTHPLILNGDESTRVDTILHIYPHTGFSVKHLEMALQEHPEIDTVLASISRVKPDHPLVSSARQKGLTFICGNTHAMEILENGLPLAFSLQALLPGVEVILLRERVTATPIDKAGNASIRDYARMIAENYLIPERR